MKRLKKNQLFELLNLVFNAEIDLRVKTYKRLLQKRKEKYLTKITKG